MKSDNGNTQILGKPDEANDFLIKHMNATGSLVCHRQRQCRYRDEQSSYQIKDIGNCYYHSFFQLRNSLTNVSWASFTGTPAGFGDGDSDTVLSETQVDVNANNNGYLTAEIGNISALKSAIHKITQLLYFYSSKQ